MTWHRELRGRLERSAKRLIRGGPGEKWIRAPYLSQMSPVIVGGCGRSGTTLLSAMLDSHPHLCCGPESRLFASPGIHPRRLARLFHVEHSQIQDLIRHSEAKAQFIEQFAQLYCQQAHSIRWAEKTPGNITVLGDIWASFPQAKVIHMLRDGRDVVCSLRTHPAYKMVQGKRVKTGIRRPLERCARRWVRYVRAGLAHRDDPRYMQMRYEDLVGRTEPTLRQVFDFLDEPWDDAPLRYHERKLGSADPLRAVQNPGIDKPIHTSSIGRWKHDFSTRDVAVFKRIAGPLLVELGYVENDQWGV